VAGTSPNECTINVFNMQHTSTQIYFIWEEDISYHARTKKSI